MKSLLLTLFLIILFVSFGKAQANELSEADKNSIISFILQSYDFPDRDLKPFSTVYLLNKNISLKQMPLRKGICFNLISQLKIDEMKDNGVEYYEFTDFEKNGREIKIYFSREYFHSKARQNNGSGLDYSCRKVRGKWKCKASAVDAWAS
jgi:hypothetical protein